eukprot:8514018-Karenia_brevis.AAC.1
MSQSIPRHLHCSHILLLQVAPLLDPLYTAIVSLGSWRQNTSHATDMNSYIALSRVRAAHDLMLTDTLAQSIFSGGAHPWPTELSK